MINKNDKQATKSQIEMLKQKYLKKNIQHAQQVKVLTENTQKVQTNKILLSPNVSANAQINLKMNSAQKPMSQLKQPNIKEKVPQKIKNEQQITNKKQWCLRSFMEAQNVKQKQSTRVETNKQNDQQLRLQVNHKDPFNLNIPFQFCQAPSTQHKSNDLQYSQQLSAKQKNVPSQHKVKDHQVQPVKDVVHACKLWTQSASKCLSYLYYSSPDLQTNPSTLPLHSKNPKFPGIVQQLAQNFIFTANQQLKDNQKQVVYNMCLQYFSPSPKYLSDVLLICLIKISPLYATIYSQQIIRKPTYYMEKIVQYKKYLLKQEIDVFVKCLEQRLESLRIEGYKIGVDIYLWILILRPLSNYCHQILLAKNIQNQRDFLIIFCALNADGKENGLSILYLKCIDALIPLFIKSGTLEKVISNLNQLKIPELLYQPVKSLKLKLIKAADTKKDKKKTDEQKGFTSFLNEKMSKLKDALQSRINNKTKTDVYYDPGTATYQKKIPQQNKT